MSQGWVLVCAAAATVALLVGYTALDAERIARRLREYQRR